MSLFRAKPEAADVIRPSLLHNGVLGLGCLILGVALLWEGAAAIEGATFMAIFFLLSAAVIMATHLPGCTGVWLDDEGFLVRDFYKSERYRWSEVGPFTLRRRLFGAGIEFSFTPPGETLPQPRTLPRSLDRSGRRIVHLMNQRRERAIGAGT